ncbi:hypothetical protein MGLY_25060 [Neomoorella glycerini]|uniref:Winged helix-turn helix n=1 Tax=Neomoorella glycerini TaxID=55779 RepID=A0A6I5ZTU1_9FIRM|nr:hypothetical protein MGLY_25060 [Moorella glycerini]
MCKRTEKMSLWKRNLFECQRVAQVFVIEQVIKGKITNRQAAEVLGLSERPRAIAELGINHIPACSSQAKGRVERLRGTLQGRLVVELRLAGISTLEEANAFLPGFIQRFNRRFAVTPACPEPAYALALLRLH